MLSVDPDQIEQPRTAPKPTLKPELTCSFPIQRTVTGPVIGLKSLQQERLLFKQRLQVTRSNPQREGMVMGWLSERTGKCTPGTGLSNDLEEEHTEKLQSFTRRREHSKTAVELQSLPTQILLLSQESEVPRECPVPVRPPTASRLPASSHISPVRYRMLRLSANCSPQKGRSKRRTLHKGKI